MTSQAPTSRGPTDAGLTARVLSSEWQPIASHPEKYEVSESGVVRNKSGRVLKQWVSDQGYAKVCIGGKSVSVHRLVAIGFLENPNMYPEINHKDGVKNNNSVSNLEWCSRSQNMKHAYAIGLHPGLRGADSPNYGRCGSKHIQSMAVRAVFHDGTYKDYESQKLAAKDNFRPEKISECIHGRRKTHGGAAWMPLPTPPTNPKGAA